MNKHRWLAGVMGLLAWGTAVPAGAQAVKADMLEATTKHFVIVADLGEAELRRRAARLEQFHALLSTLAPERSENRLLIYLTDGISTIQEMAHMDSIGGYYIPTVKGAFAVSPADVDKYPGWSPQIVLFHEYTHHMMLQSNDAYFPGWVHEGLAELFATAKIAPNGDIVVGAPNASRAAAVTSFHSWTVERMLGSDLAKVGKDEVIQKYARSTLLLHYLLLNRERAPLFGKYIDAINHGTDPVAAGRQVFGDLKALDSAIELYSRQKRVPSALYKADQLHPATDATIRPVPRDEEDALRIRLESDSDEDHEYTAGLLSRARRLAAAYPGSAKAQAVVAQVEYEAGNYAEAGAAADRALAFDPGNIAAILYKGRVLGQAAIKSKVPADWTAARAMFLRANRLDPNYPWTFVLLYDAYLAEGRAPSASAVTGLKRAVVLAPQDDGLRIRMAFQSLHDGDIPTARLMLAGVALSPHGKPDAPAARFYPDLLTGKDAPALLARGGELKLWVNSFFPKPPADKSKKSSDRIQ